MNLFSKISDIVFGKAGPTCIAQLPSGQLIHSKPAESSSVVLFARSSASILSTGAHNQFQLIISCMDTLDEKAFLIDEKLRMTEDLCWKDLESPSAIHSFQFIPDTALVSPKSINDFYQVFMQCAFQRLYSRLPESQEEFEEFTKVPFFVSNRSQGSIDKKSNFSKSNETLVERDETSVYDKNYVSIQKSGSDLLKLPAELYLYDARFDQFVRLHEQVDVFISALGTYRFGIFIQKSGMNLLAYQKK